MSSGGLLSQGSWHAGLTRQGRIGIAPRMSSDSFAEEDVLQLVSKRTAELEREREANLLLQR